MAGHLQRVVPSRHFLVFNRTDAVARKHAAEFENSERAGDVKTMARRSDVIFLCLPNSNVVHDVVCQMRDGFEAKRSATIVVDCTSGDPNATRRIQEEISAYDVAVVDAPISGGPGGAEKGTLTVMLGGNDRGVTRTVKELCVKSFASVANVVGGLGAGHATKAVNNALNASHLVMASEGLLRLRQRYDVLPSDALSVINKSSGRSLQTEVRIPTEVVSGKFDYGFKIGLMLKDVRIALKVMSDDSVETDGSSTYPGYFERTERFLSRAVEMYGHDADYTEVVRVLERDAGVTLRAPGAVGIDN